MTNISEGNRRLLTSDNQIETSSYPIEDIADNATMDTVRTLIRIIDRERALVRRFVEALVIINGLTYLEEDYDGDIYTVSHQALGTCCQQNSRRLAEHKEALLKAKIVDVDEEVEKTISFWVASPSEEL